MYGILLSVLQNNITFRFSLLVYGIYALYIDRLMTSQRKFHCLPFVFTFIRIHSCTVNPEILGFCLSETEAVRIDNKRE